MRVKTKVKSKSFNKKLFADLKAQEQRIKAGYPKESPSSHEKDVNGFTALEKAYEINFANKDFIPYLQIAYTKNKIKYHKKYIKIASLPPKQQGKMLDKLGADMVNDIKQSLANYKFSPLLTGKGLLFSAISFKRVKK